MSLNLVQRLVDAEARVGVVWGGGSSAALGAAYSVQWRVVVDRCRMSLTWQEWIPEALRAHVGVVSIVKVVAVSSEFPLFKQV
jgi:hypothetical protein